MTNQSFFDIDDVKDLDCLNPSSRSKDPRSFITITFFNIHFVRITIDSIRWNTICSIHEKKKSRNITKDLGVNFSFEKLHLTK